jgi:hypothetical protein
MKVKNASLFGKFFLVVCGLTLSILKWCGVLPDADIGEIWKSMAFAYGIALGTVDINICRDSWTEKKESTTAQGLDENHVNESEEK